mgnify:CR=1 FL=1
MAGYEVGESDQRDWGGYIVTAVNYDGNICALCEKDITVKPGFMLSVQSHDRREENWIVSSGTLTVVLDGEVIRLETGEEIDIPMGAVHTMANCSDAPCVVHEIQKGDCAEDDIHRYWDPNGRPVEQSADERVLDSIKSCEDLMAQMPPAKKKR